MSRHANYEVVRRVAQDPDTGALDVYLRDLGPWDRHFTVTNDAEHVVEELTRRQELRPGYRLFCWDSEGSLDELRHDGAGRFLGFAPGPGAREGG